MKWVKVGEKMINLASVALVEKNGPRVTVHFMLPEPQVVPGVVYPSDAAPPTATGHVDGQAALDLWDVLVTLA